MHRLSSYKSNPEAGDVAHLNFHPAARPRGRSRGPRAIHIYRAYDGARGRESNAVRSRGSRFARLASDETRVRSHFAGSLDVMVKYPTSGRSLRIEPCVTPREVLAASSFFLTGASVLYSRSRSMGSSSGLKYDSVYSP